MSQLLKKPKRSISRVFEMNWEIVPLKKKVKNEITFNQFFNKNFGEIGFSRRYRITVETV